MKQTLMTAETLILFALIILFPGVILEGAQAGLLLWFNTVLPALLPFLILSNLLALLQQPAFATIAGLMLIAATIVQLIYWGFFIRSYRLYSRLD